MSGFTVNSWYFVVKLAYFQKLYVINGYKWKTANQIDSCSECTILSQECTEQILLESEVCKFCVLVSQPFNKPFDIVACLGCFSKQDYMYDELNLTLQAF